MTTETVAYRKSATPGTPPASASQKRLEALRCCPLGRLVLQLTELDDEIANIREDKKPSRIAIAAIMSIKFNVLKALLPYAYATVPATKEVDNVGRVPITINLAAEDVTREERILVEQINDALDGARQQFPAYKPN